MRDVCKLLINGIELQVYKLLNFTVCYSNHQQHLSDNFSIFALDTTSLSKRKSACFFNNHWNEKLAGISPPEQ